MIRSKNNATENIFLTLKKEGRRKEKTDIKKTNSIIEFIKPVLLVSLVYVNGLSTQSVGKGCQNGFERKYFRMCYLQETQSKFNDTHTHTHTHTCISHKIDFKKKNIVRNKEGYFANIKRVKPSMM